ncbi:hypothetical protein BJ165DRAFT_764526 [Panaeolus papilionaceus]|nr:hypothetical protein BJ165DRAFT_764526 [Panaeolus papilionaceus]
MPNPLRNLTKSINCPNLLPAPSFSTSQIITSTPKPVPGATTAKPRSRQSNPLQNSFILATPSLPERQTTPPPPASSDSNPKAAPLQNSQSLPAIPLPQTPVRPNQTFSTSNINVNNKRILELEEVQAQKRARTVHSPHVAASTRPKTPEAQVAQTSGSQQLEPSPSPRFIACPTNPLFAGPVPVPVPPTTPTKKSKALPTLTELLASGRKNKDGRKSTRLTPKAAPALVTKSSSKGKEREFVPDVNSFNNYDENAAKDQGTYPSIPPGQVLDSLPAPVVIDEENPYMLGPNDLQPAPDDIDLLLATKAVDLSPTKSLSSIADSDEEDEDDIPNSPPPDSSPIVGTFSFNPSGFSFNPQATSTQNQYGPFSALHGSPGAAGDQSLSFLGGSFPFRSSQGSTSSKGPAPSSRYAYRFNKSSESQNNNNNLPANSMDSWASVYKHRSFQYNSQLQSNIAKQVDQVDKLLEKDVDYEGWLKDPSPETEEREGAAAGGGMEDSP